MSADKETNRRLFLEAVTNGSDKRESAEALGIPGRTARRWWAEEQARLASAPRLGPARDKKLSKHRRFVFVSVQNDRKTNQKFYKSLETYCRLRKCELRVIPVRYEVHAGSTWDAKPEHMHFEDAQISKRLRLLTRLNISPTIADVFQGVAPLSKGDWLITPHPQLAMESLSSIDQQHAQMWTTGSMSEPARAYSRTKTGYKAEFNHSLAAIVVELGENEDDHPHIRDLNFDGEGFYDWTGYYKPNGFIKRRPGNVWSMLTGDEHWIVHSPIAMAATYFRKDSMANVMGPKLIFRGDVVDAQTISHHDNHNGLQRIGKQILGLNILERELDFTFDMIAKSTPVGSQNVFVDSNHHRHLDQWLASEEAKHDLVNAKIYHRLMYLMLDGIEQTAYGVKYPNPLELFVKDTRHAEILEYSQFLSGSHSYKVGSVEMSLHGDRGAGGARGSPKGFAMLPFKSSAGHGHAPCIVRGHRRVGVLGSLVMSYTGSLSAWMASNVLHYDNDKRQTINIVNEGDWHGPAVPGEWRGGDITFQ
ncbi:hypothetical protein LXA47_31430 [Massilia sp. P8910]|uniref:hypothetical protein n=1 Tax=Massilia antarctica TaxID=2765360 RepID=UPI001E490AB2|nr:hypothetical protein [Massilia antarctica]MCE3608084.1 hypothetical protein [Massilia antarctica]